MSLHKFSLRKTLPTSKDETIRLSVAFLAYFVLLALGGIDNGCTTDFGHFLSIAVKTPATDLFTSGHVFDEENSVV